MKSKKRILCVDDLAEFCGLVSIVLSDYDVTSADSKSEALLKASTEKFDLYLLDYYLPDGNGLDLYNSIRNFDAWTPAIFITNSRRITNDQAVALGAEGVIEKYHLTDQLPKAAARALAHTKNNSVIN